MRKKKEKSVIYRHGDVGLIPVAKQDIEFKECKQAVLALGEVTGHSHIVTPDLDNVTIAIAETAEGKFLRVTNGNAILRHEEHHAIILPAGDFKIVIQREYDPLGNRLVRD